MSSDSDSSEHEQALDLTVGEDDNTITDDTNETAASSKRKLQHHQNKKKDGGDSDNNKKRRSSTERQQQNGPHKNQNGGKSTRRKTPSSPRRSPAKSQNKHKRVSPGKKTVRHNPSPQHRPNTDEFSALDAKMEIILSTMQATQAEVLQIQSKQSALEAQLGPSSNTSVSGTSRKRPLAPAASSPATIVPSKKGSFDVVPQQQNQQHPSQTLPTATISTTSVSTHSTPATHSALPYQHTDTHQDITPTIPVPDSVQYGVSAGTNLLLPTGGAPSDPWASFRNPFMPPALKETLLKKIEDRIFVDFQDLHPDNQMADYSNSSNTPTIQVDQHSGLLTQKDFAAKKARINSFPRWSSCFMLFAQAHLHYHPEDYFLLFTYHAIMIENFNNYHYDACVKYDRNVRLSMANQRNLAPERKTVHWNEINQPIKSFYLAGNELSRCSYCKGTGHHASACRQKQEDEARNLPRQIAAAMTEVFPHPHYQPPAPARHQQQHSTYGAFRGRQSSSSNSYNQQNQQSSFQSSPVPAQQKYCRRFNNNTPCAKPPCQFIHSCSACGLANHNLTSCYRATSTNFIPVSK